jgi:hypothetical protein
MFYATFDNSYLDAVSDPNSLIKILAWHVLHVGTLRILTRN